MASLHPPLPRQPKDPSLPSLPGERPPTALRVKIPVIGLPMVTGPLKDFAVPDPAPGRLTDGISAALPAVRVTLALITARLVVVTMTEIAMAAEEEMTSASAALLVAVAADLRLQATFPTSRDGSSMISLFPPTRSACSAAPFSLEVSRKLRQLPYPKTTCTNRCYSCPEPELRQIFGRFGTVQTCIVNKDKRHAFVKMLTRKDAEAAKTNMEDNRHLDVPLRVSHYPRCYSPSIIY